MAFLKNSISAIAILGLMSGAAVAADLEPVADAPVAAPQIFDNNFYVSLFAGANIATGDTDFSNGINAVQTDFDTGFLVGGALGYKWKNFNWNGISPRTEIEVNYFRNDVGSIDFTGNGPGNETLNGDNTISGVGVFGNLFFDWNNAFNTRITPYVGGGVGVAFVNNNLLYNDPGLNLNDNDTAFAFNVGAGASYPVSRSASLFIDARYNRIVDVDSERRLGGASIAGPAGGNFEDDFSTVQIRSGIKVSF